MNNYIFKIFDQEGVQANQGSGSGDNSIEAFENAMRYGLYLPHSGWCTVLATNTDTNLTLKMEVRHD